MRPAHRVYIACQFPAEVLALFLSRFNDVSYNDSGHVLQTEELVSHAQGKDVLLLTATDVIDKATVLRLPSSVKVIGTYSVGTDHLDLDALRDKGIKVLNTPDVLNESCADTALLLMLGAARRVTESAALIRDGSWSGWTPSQLIGLDVWGKRIGILGMGRIGQAIAKRARGFSMQVHYHNRKRLAAPLELGAQYHSSLASLAQQSDFLCIACPASPATRSIVNHQVLELLPSHAIVCNISRGDIIQDEDLINALRTGKVAAAGLDVFAGEPDIHPAYRSLPNVFGLPHIGSSTIDTRLAMAKMLCHSLDEVLKGGTPTNQVE